MANRIIFVVMSFPNTIPEEGSLASDPSNVEKAEEFGRLLASA